MDEVITRSVAPPGPQTEPVSREKLHAEVWAEPMLAVAARYGVSSSFMARVCERLNVPRPPRGYWARLKVGRAPKKPPLPAARPGDELEWARGGELRRLPRALPKPPEGKGPKRLRPRAERPALHELVLGAKELFLAGRENDGGYLRPSKRLLVDLFVSRGSLDRALEVANEVFLSFEDRGYPVMFTPRDGPSVRPELDERAKATRTRNYYQGWSPARPTVVFIGTVAFGLTIFELSEEVEARYLNGKYVRVADLPASKRAWRTRDREWTTRHELASGRLCLRLSSPYSRAPWERKWHESAPGDLERKFPRILKELKAEAPVLAKRVEEGQRQAELEHQRWLEQREKWRREEEERQRIRNIEESRKDLLGAIEDWGEARRIEEFFANAERRATKLPEDERGAILDRLRRARDLIGDVDALETFLSWRAPEER